MKRRKFTSTFKTKVVLEVLKERQSVADLARICELQPTQISAWKHKFLEGATEVFDKGKTIKKSETELEKELLMKTIGQQRIEIDF